MNVVIAEMSAQRCDLYLPATAMPPVPCTREKVRFAEGEEWLATVEMGEVGGRPENGSAKKERAIVFNKG